MRKLYIISGCNGAGKTIASYTILPELLNCREFVNADEIARGLSPLNPESEALKAGRLMLIRINELLKKGKDFAFETTLATKSYKNFIFDAKQLDYKVTLLFLWLRTPELAVQRVKKRVEEGGHNIPELVIRRRYENGLKNFYNIFEPIVDDWIFIDNSETPSSIIANKVRIYNSDLWNKLIIKYKQ